MVRMVIPILNLNTIKMALEPHIAVTIMVLI